MQVCPSLCMKVVVIPRPAATHCVLSCEIIYFTAINSCRVAGEQLLHSSEQGYHIVESPVSRPSTSDTVAEHAANTFTSGSALSSESTSYVHVYTTAQATSTCYKTQFCHFIWGPKIVGVHITTLISFFMWHSATGSRNVPNADRVRAPNSRENAELLDS